MKKVFIVTTIVLMIIAIVLYVCFRKFLKTHAEEEVGQHEKVLYAYLIGMIGVSILTGLSGIMLCLLE